MKKTRLLELVREIINEELELESQASDDAKRQGLERKPGFGNYGPPGKDLVTHVSRGGKLEPIGEPKKTTTAKATSPAGPPNGSPDKPEGPKQNASGEKPAISKDVHRDPKVQNAVIDKLEKLGVNADGYGGGWHWDGESYQYDDEEGGYDYYAEITPLDNDEYEVIDGSMHNLNRTPIRLKGLRNVMSHLNPKRLFKH